MQTRNFSQQINTEPHRLKGKNDTSPERKSSPLRRWKLVLIGANLWMTFLFSTFALEAKAAEFTPIFDGKTLSGWTTRNVEGRGVLVENGEIVYPGDSGGDLITVKQYSDFVLRFEFKTAENGNNGIGIRTPMDGDFAYTGMEIQVLDDSGSLYKDLKPWQAHGSVYGVVAAKKGSQKPVGSWNTEEITAIGRKIRVKVNGKTIVDTDLNAVIDPAILAAHPGVLRERGHLALLGHGPAEVRFRNLSVKDLSRSERENVAPAGFVRLFDGKTLDGWQGLVGNPITRAKMSPEALALAKQKATTEAQKHWRVVDNVIVYDGKNDNLCTAKDYGNFELWVDWKLPAHGDSGLYLRGSPQVQIWDDKPEVAAKIGSGGLYNNQKNPSNPTKKADNPIGEWNRFHILMIGERVTVWLNGELVVHNVPLENYWERDKPIYPRGAIELQHHGDTLSFRNIFVRELP